MQIHAVQIQQMQNFKKRTLLKKQRRIQSCRYFSDQNIPSPRFGRRKTEIIHQLRLTGLAQSKAPR